YYNAREALTGYNRVLTGSGRSSEKTLELQLQTLPDPAISDDSYAAKSLNAFKQNLTVVDQGIPHIPGIKHPSDWEQQTAPWQPAQWPAQPRQQATSNNAPWQKKISLLDLLGNIFGGR